MGIVKVNAPGKINLALSITGRRPDGMHEMDMVMQTVGLYDTITVQTRQKAKQPCPEGIRLTCSTTGVPCDDANIAWKCAKGFFEQIGLTGSNIPDIDIHIEKHIPIMAGLGGGSADGAGILTALNYLFEAKLSQQQLCEIGVYYGADIPFCITGGTARATGIGEKIVPLPSLPECYLLIAKPHSSVSTKEAFSAFDQLNHFDSPLDNGDILQGLHDGDICKIAQSMCNSFEALDTPDMQDIPIIRREMIEAGAYGARMTGSGSAVFGIFNHSRPAKSCMYTLEREVEKIFLVRPVEHGPEVLSIIQN